MHRRLMPVCPQPARMNELDLQQSSYPGDRRTPGAGPCSSLLTPSRVIAANRRDAHVHRPRASDAGGMLNLGVWLEARFCELGLASAAQYHRVDDSYDAVSVATLLVSLHLACHRPLALRFAAPCPAPPLYCSAGF